jgi:hypothetical protein
VWRADKAERISGIKLDGSELRAQRAGSWSREVNRYMDGLGDDILIHEVAAEYRDLVTDFYAWFDEAIRRRNQQALDELGARSAEVHSALTAAWGPVVHDPANVPPDYPQQ